MRFYVPAWLMNRTLLILGASGFLEGAETQSHETWKPVE